MNKLLTIGLISNDENVLLGMKKRGFGAGRWNGFGGKVQPEETIDQAACREFLEECLVKITKYEKRGIIEFEFKGDSTILEVHIYKMLEYSGTPTETDEMRPQWFKKSEIPYEQMWPDDKYWLPLFLKDKKFRGRVYFENQDKIINSDIREVSSLEAA